MSIVVHCESCGRESQASTDPGAERICASCAESLVPSAPPPGSPYPDGVAALGEEPAEESHSAPPSSEGKVAKGKAPTRRRSAIPKTEDMACPKCSSPMERRRPVWAIVLGIGVAIPLLPLLLVKVKRCEHCRPSWGQRHFENWSIRKTRGAIFCSIAMTIVLEELWRRSIGY